MSKTIYVNIKNRNELIKIFVVFIIILSFGNVVVNAQENPPPELWRKTFGIKGHLFDEWAKDVQQTSDGGYIIAGNNYLEETRENAWLIKTDGLGNKQWSKTFWVKNHPSSSMPNVSFDTRYFFEGAQIVQQTIDGGYIVLGSVGSVAESRYTSWIIKTDAVGNEQWSQILNEKNHVSSIRQTKDGGFILYSSKKSGKISVDVGSSQSTGNVLSKSPSGAVICDRNPLLIKMDSSGSLEWNKTIEEVYDWCPRSFQQTSDGGYILTGETFQNRYTGLIKTDAKGNLQWNKNMEISKIYDIQQTSDGGYIIIGSDRQQMISTIVKIDTSGNFQWNKTLEPIPQQIQQTTDGGYIAMSFDSFIKTDSNGNLSWKKNFEGKIYLKTVRQTSDGDYIIAGSVREGQDRDFILLKVSSIPAETTPTPAPTSTYSQPVSSQAPTPKAPAFNVLLTIGALFVVILIRKRI